MENLPTFSILLFCGLHEGRLSEFFVVLHFHILDGQMVDNLFWICSWEIWHLFKLLTDEFLKFNGI